MQKQKYDTLIYIGRFQPLTLAHEEIIQTALELADKLIIFAGSAFIARDIRNPFNFEERVAMIKSARFYNDNSDRIKILPLSDSNYDLNWWIQEVNRNVSVLCKPHSKIGLIGHNKDVTSYYLKVLSYDLAETGTLKNNLSATNVRKKFFSDEELGEGSVSFEIKKFLMQWKEENKDEFLYLREEFKHIGAFSKDKSLIFQAAYAIIKHDDKILLIKRKNFPGKNLFSLPGCFFKQKETVEDVIKTMLKEKLKLSFENPDLIKVFDAPDRDNRGTVIAHTALYDFDKIKINAEFKLGLDKISQTADDISDTFWLDISELSKNRTLFFCDHYKIIGNILKLS